MNDYLSPVASRHTRTKHLHDHHTSHRVNPDDTDDFQTSTMAHKIAEPYSGKNPVPTEEGHKERDLSPKKMSDSYHRVVCDCFGREGHLKKDRRC